MLATFIIGLREGLEAALIVGVIAAFLRNNGKSRLGMWLGVTLAVMLSIAVGVGLELAQRGLPQAEQEGLETIIGFVAVVFVTGMIVWMNTHARDLKGQLEAEATRALSRSSSFALAGMAFLAVLKEGFETSVFLLATFSVAQSTVFAVAGATIGLIVAVGIGWGIYVGGVRFNLSRFFRFTAAFLILVAAGLVLASLRTAHEAGWLIAGQQPTIDLAWLVAPGTIQSALITGVLGIPADPRLIEVIGWFAYLIPVALYIYWPRSHRPRSRAAARLKIAIAAVAAGAAIGLVLAYPKPQLQAPVKAALVDATTTASAPIGSAQFAAATAHAPGALSIHLDDGVTASVPLPLHARQQDRHQGIEAFAWTIKNASTVADAPTTLTLEQVVALSGGRIPIGLSPQQHPGPFTASWTLHRALRVWTTKGVLLDAKGHNVTTVALSSSDLTSPRTVVVRHTEGLGAGRQWQASPHYVDQVVRALDRTSLAHTERRLWALRLPVLLAIIALVLLVQVSRAWLLARRSAAAGRPADPKAKSDPRFTNPEIQGASYVAH